MTGLLGNWTRDSYDPFAKSVILRAGCNEAHAQPDINWAGRRTLEDTFLGTYSTGLGRDAVHY